MIASLDKVLEVHRGQIFNYADIYAGYAHNPLVRGNEWQQGIAKLRNLQELDKNNHTALYVKWYLSRPQLSGGVYPGSSLIASDVCAWRNKRVHLSLWDTSEKVIADLTMVFGGQQHDIHPHSANPSDTEVRYADFLLIDPPEYQWKTIRDFLEDSSRAILVWLPIKANTITTPPGEDAKSQRSRKEAQKIGLGVTKVRWSKGGRTIGCLLVYRLPDAAVRALQSAVEHVSRILNWDCCHY